MTIEHAHAHSLPKPWGVVDTRPWSPASDNAISIGEIWNERSDPTAAPPSLLLKLLFTNQPLSIQVYADDAYARACLVADTGRLVPQLLKCADMEKTQ